MALEEIDPDAVVTVLKAVIKGTHPDFNRVWRPTPAELAEWARIEALDAKRRNTPLYSGILEADFGHGRIDMRGLTVEEQDLVLRHKGMTPDGHNLAMLSLEAKKRALAGEKPVLTVVPKVKRIE